MDSCAVRHGSGLADRGVVRRDQGLELGGPGWPAGEGGESDRVRGGADGVRAGAAGAGAYAVGARAGGRLRPDHRVHGDREQSAVVGYGRDVAARGAARRCGSGGVRSGGRPSDAAGGHAGHCSGGRGGPRSRLHAAVPGWRRAGERAGGHAADPGDGSEDRGGREGGRGRGDGSGRRRPETERVGVPERVQGAGAERAERGAGARDPPGRLQRAHDPVRGAGAGAGAAGPDRDGAGLPERALLLPCLAGGLARRMGGGGPDVGAVPGGRGALAVRRGRAGAAGGTGATHGQTAAGGAMIRLEGVTKRYGAFTAVHPTDLHVKRGELFGFLGPNGAGKTTTIRMVAGVLQPTSGRVLVGGHDMAREPLAAKRLLGYIPDRPFLYEKLTGAEFLRFVTGLWNQNGAESEKRADELLELFELDRWKHTVIESYSHG